MREKAQFGVMALTVRDPADSSQSTGLSASPGVWQSLQHHAQRRLRGVPTISVIVGDGAAAYCAWLEGGLERFRPLAAWSTESKQSLFETWLSVIVNRCSLSERIFQYLALHTNEPENTVRARVSGSTRHSLDVYWQSMALPKTAEWLKLVLEQTREGGAKGTELVSQVLGFLQTDHNHTADVFNSFLLLYQAHELPGMWVATHSRGNHRSKNELSREIVPLVTDVSETMPSLPIAVSVGSEVVAEYLLSAPESHAKALFREGIVEIIASESAQVPIGAAFCDSLPDSVDDAARSENERFLFAQLESRPQTAGVFRLNAGQEYKFGSRRMEIDLFSETYSIAVELDGFHHFQDPEAYRRDRRKDAALQRLGIFVLRFLSDDVVSGLEHILATVDETIALQQSRLDGQKDQGLLDDEAKKD